MTKQRKTVQKGVPQTVNEFINELRDEAISCGQVKSGDQHRIFVTELNINAHFYVILKLFFDNCVSVSGTTG